MIERRITDSSDRIIGVHDYHAFGPEAGGGQNEPSLSLMKFTGHERDLWKSESYDTLDYMHARYAAHTLGRFMSVDPIISRGVVRMPQRWNRYAYGMNNPMRYTDPTGMKVQCHTIPATDNSPERLICAESIDVEGKTPKVPTIGGSISSLFDLIEFAAGNLPRRSAADPRSAQDLSNTPVMDQIRDKYKQSGCKDGRFYGDFQYGELVTTPPVSTGQMVGSFGADIRGIGHGLVVVKAFNTWGLESATRLPGRSNRGNASVQQMLGGAPLQYPKSLLENRSDGPGGTATLNYIWTEGSPCAQ